MSECVGVNGFVWNTTIVGVDGEVVDRFTTKNVIPAEGMAFLVRSPFGDVSPISTFYLGLFRGDYIPGGSSKASDIPGNMIECIDFEEAARPLWDRAFNGVATMDNEGSKAEFTFTQDRLIHGAFLVTDPVKGSGNGMLLSCVRYPSPKQVYAGQKATLSGGLTYISTNVI